MREHLRENGMSVGYKFVTQIQIQMHNAASERNALVVIEVCVD